MVHGGAPLQSPCTIQPHPQERCQVAVRTRARTSTTAVEPGLIVLMLQAAYLGCNHREVIARIRTDPLGALLCQRRRCGIQAWWSFQNRFDV